ncbi:MAG: hypothetical protein GY841_14925 [FCB group bacterium]|nr:hypothetical protein [FCB group bacterium]
MKRCFSFLGIFLLLSGVAISENRIDVKIRQGDNPDVDTIWTGVQASFDYYFENDEPLSAFTTGFEVYSNDGAGWEWKEDIFQISTSCSYPPLICYADTAWNHVTAVEGSRMWPPWDIWDMAHLGLTIVDSSTDWSGTSPDRFCIGGVHNTAPLMPAGPLEHALTMQFIASGPADDEVMTICIDSTNIGTAWDFLFVCEFSNNTTPEVWGIGERCWPVKFVYTSGDANWDQAVNVGDAVYLINYVFKNGPASFVDCLSDADGNGDLNVGDAVHLINFVFKGGSAPLDACGP